MKKTDTGARCRLAEINVGQFIDKPVLDAALAYALKRVSLIPVASDETKAALVRWKAYQRQAATPATVERWFTRECPNASIGLVSGKLNGILVVDLDTAEDEDFFLDKYPLARNTLSVTTPRGRHVYFQHCDGLRNNIGILGRQIDVRTTGGYVRAPTSAGYRYVQDRPILPPPVELIADITADRVIPHKKIVGDGQIIAEGLRNVTLFKFCCGLQASGYSDDQIFAALVDVNTLRVNPGLQITELQSIHRSVTSRYPKGTAGRSAMAAGRTEDGYYICRAIRQYRQPRKNRESQIVEWQEPISGQVFLQYFNTYSRFSIRSKAVINYTLLFGELPKRLDRVDFARFVGVTAVVQISNSRPNVEWLRQYPGLSTPDLLIESRITDVICALKNSDQYTARE